MEYTEQQIKKANAIKGNLIHTAIEIPAEGFFPVLCVHATPLNKAEAAACTVCPAIIAEMLAIEDPGFWLAQKGKSSHVMVLDYIASK